MNKVFKLFFTFLAVAVLLCSVAVSANAIGTVRYIAEANDFIFEPGSAYSPTDLFSDYKGLMPGDSVKQDITVRNDSSHGVKVKIYVRSLGAHEDSVDFLSKLHLTVAKAEQNKMEYMFDAPADQTDGMTDWVYLGTLYSGGEVDLVLNLDIPIELGNEYQDAIGYIDWEFMVEKLPVDPDDPLPPQTGDDSNLLLYAILAGFSVICLIILIFAKRRNKVKAY